MEELDLRWQMAMLTMRARRFLKKQEGSLLLMVMRLLILISPMWSATTATRGDNLLRSAELQEIKTTSTWKAQEGECACGNIYFYSFGFMNSLGGYDWSDVTPANLYIAAEYNIGVLLHNTGSRVTVEEGPNYELMAFSSSSYDSEKGLGYANYNAVPLPYTRNFMPLTPDLSYTGLDEFVNKHVVKNCKAKSSEEEPKVVRKNDDAPIIKEWVSDNEEEDVSRAKTEKKIVRPSIAKIEFVKSKQQEKTARKTIKQVKQHRQNTHSPKGNQIN
nr:hypothetical protein [Tanacetum cinerariifolium]